MIGSGSNFVQFVHVKDAAQGFYLALDREVSWGQTYFIAEDRWHSYSEVCEILSRITGRDPPTLSVPKYLAKALVNPVHLERDRALVQAERNSAVAPERERPLTSKNPPSRACLQ